LVEEAGDELQRQYDRAVAEYRFQVELNWRRSEYFFVLNIGVLVAASTLLASHKVPRLLIAAVFVIGAIFALLSISANKTQHGYYRSARKLKQDLEAKIPVAESHALATTPGMGSKVARLGRVGTFLTVMLVAIAVVDVLGAALIGHEAWTEHHGHRQVVVVFHTSASRGVTHPLTTTIVVATDGNAVFKREATLAGGYRSVELEPGDYEVWTSSRPGCHRTVHIDETPLQLVEIGC
jgi:hypothetical protein